MDIGQIKAASWAAAALLTIGLAAYVWSFFSHLEAKRNPPDQAVVRATLTGVELVQVKNDGQVAYADVKRLFHDLNWTGAVKVKPKIDEAQPQDTTPKAVPVTELVRVLAVQVDLAERKGSVVFLRYRAKAAVLNPGIGGVLLHEGDTLAKPHDYARIDAITAQGVAFAFSDAAREPETLRPAEFDAKAEIVEVGPDGVVMPPRTSLIPRIDGAPFRPGKTTPLGRNRFVLGTDDMAQFEQNYSEILARDVRLSQHRVPKTGRYDGIEITEVAAGSLAGRNGAQSGDVVKSINGHAVNSTQEAINFVKMNKDKYSTWEVVIENKGKTRTVTYASPGH